MMPAYNFKPQFRNKILAGEKRHTIRAKRARPPQVGDACHLFCGMRTKQCELLGRFPCVKVEDILIARFAGDFEIKIDGVPLDASEKEALARRDGFASLAEMAEFWERAHPRTVFFRGDVIHWRFPE